MKDHRSTEWYKAITDYIYRRALDIINNKDIDYIKIDNIYFSRRGNKVNCSFPTPLGHKNEVIHKDKTNDDD